jgi:hypothetical protein
MAPETLGEQFMLPGLPEGTAAIRYGVIKDPADRLLLANGRITKLMYQHTIGLVVQLLPGYREIYIPADDQCIVRRDDSPKMLTAKMLILDEKQEAGIRRTLEEMGFAVS